MNYYLRGKYSSGGRAFEFRFTKIYRGQERPDKCRMRDTDIVEKLPSEKRGLIAIIVKEMTKKKSHITITDYYGNPITRWVPTTHVESRPPILIPKYRK